MTIRRGYLITSARHICVAAILFSLLASTAWGQDEADLRISTLTRELKQGDSFVRWRAAKALLRIGSYSKADVPALIEALKIEEGDISERARDALVKIGPDAVPALIKALKYRDSLAYSKAIEALTAIGPPTLPALIEALKDHDEDVRLGILEALREGNLREVNTRPATMPILIEALKDPNPAIRSAAAQSIQRFGAEAAPAYLALIEILKDPDPEVRSAADFAISCVHLPPGDPSARVATALLMEALKNQESKVRSNAAYALASMRSTAKPALDALIEASKDPDETVRSNVAQALGSIEPAADAVVATLLKALSDPDKSVRSASASALKSAPTRAAIAALIVALQDREASVRRNAAGSLARRDAGDAVPRLIQLMSDQDKEVRNAAINALGAIRPGAAQAVVEALKHQDGNIRSGAALILGKLGPSPRALAALIEALKDQDASVRRSAALSIGSFVQGPEAKTVIPALIEALKDPDESVRSRTALALSGVTGRPGEGPGHSRAEGEFVWPFFLPKPVIPTLPKSVIPILIEALKDQDRAVRSQAAEALAGIGPAARAAIPALIESIEDRNPDVSRYATYALSRVGGKSPAIIPGLIKLLKHPDGGVREVATEALVNVGAPAVPPLVKVLMGQDSALRVKSYYALLSIENVPALIAAMKSRDENLRSLIVEALDEIASKRKGGAEGTVYLLFDPSRKYLFQNAKTGCGSENVGRTIFVSELDTGKSFPILASCEWLEAEEFLESGGRYYLLIVAMNGEADCQPGSFWLYDVKANEFVIHAEGGISETERGVFSYGYCGDESETFIPVGTVTIKNLINRENPLRLMPRPMHGLTLRKNTPVFHNNFFECLQDDTNPPAITIIRTAGTRVFVISKCEDGSYEIYYKGSRGHVRKGSLKTTK